MHMIIIALFGFVSNAQDSSSVSINSAGQLTIGQAGKEHEGVWRCQVINSSGTAEVMTKLSVKFIEGNSLIYSYKIEFKIWN